MISRLGESTDKCLPGACLGYRSRDNLRSGIDDPILEINRRLFLPLVLRRRDFSVQLHSTLDPLHEHIPVDEISCNGEIELENLKAAHHFALYHVFFDDLETWSW